MTYIGIEIDPKTSAQLCWYPGAALHLTLVHFEKPTWTQTKQVVMLLNSMVTMPASLLAQGIEQWPEVGDVLLIALRGGLEVEYESLCIALDAFGVKVSTKYPFRPHITLGRATDLAREYAMRGIMIAGRGLELCGTPNIMRFTFPYPKDELL